MAVVRGFSPTAIRIGPLRGREGKSVGGARRQAVRTVRHIERADGARGQAVRTVRHVERADGTRRQAGSPCHSAFVLCVALDADVVGPFLQGTLVRLSWVLGCCPGAVSGV